MGIVAYGIFEKPLLDYAQVMYFRYRVGRLNLGQGCQIDDQVNSSKAFSIRVRQRS